MADMPRDERLVTDGDFLRALNPRRQEVKPILGALDADDLDGAKDALVEHFRTRKKPVWFFDWRDGKRRAGGPPWGDNTGVGGAAEKRADEALKHRFFLSGGLPWDFGKDLKWYTKEMRGLGSAPSTFKRCNWMRDLALTWIDTGQRKYVTGLARLIDRWLADWPLVVDEAFGPESALLSETDGHKAMPTAFRVLSWLDVLYSGILFSPGFPTETAFALIKSMWFTALQYRHYEQSRYRPANHHLWERGTAPFLFGTMFPEFPQVAKLAAQGKPVVSRHTKDSFLKDGCYEERSTSYTFAALRMFLVPHRLARLNGTSVLDRAAMGRMKRCIESGALITLPDGSLPDLGDGRPSPSGNATALGQGAALFDSRICATVAKKLRLTGQVGKQDRARVRKLKAVDLPLTVYHPSAGYFAAREKWTPSASGMSFSVPGPGLMYNHAHDDALHLQLVVRGVPVVGTPMTELYSFLNQDKYFGTKRRGHFFAMTSHNLVLVEGEPLRSIESLAPRNKWGAEPVPVKVKWEEVPGGIDVKGTHTGYPGVRLSREVEFRYGKGWTVRDRVDGKVGKPHIARWCFEYGADVEATEDGFVAERDGVRLAIRFLSPGKMRPRLRRDTKWLGKNPQRPGAPAPWVIDVRFGGEGKDELVTAFEIQKGRKRSG